MSDRTRPNSNIYKAFRRAKEHQTRTNHEQENTPRHHSPTSQSALPTHQQNSPLGNKLFNHTKPTQHKLIQDLLATHENIFQEFMLYKPLSQKILL